MSPFARGARSAFPLPQLATFPRVESRSPRVRQRHFRRCAVARLANAAIHALNQLVFKSYDSSSTPKLFLPRLNTQNNSGSDIYKYIYI